jgi:hypothetical protein
MGTCQLRESSHRAGFILQWLVSPDPTHRENAFQLIECPRVIESRRGEPGAER